jgi:sugar phosphate isomerase/epimerase
MTMKNLVSRRSFITSTSVTAAALVSGPLTRETQALPIHKTCKMKIGFMTSLAQDKTPPELIALAQQYNYQGVEFRPEWKQKHGIELTATPKQRREAKRLFADNGIDISSVSPGVKFCKDDRDQQLEKMYRYIDLTKDVGSPCIRFFADPLPKDPAQRSESHKIQAEYMAKAAARALEAGVLLGLETHSNSIGIDAGEMMHLAAYPPALRVNWHLSHCLRHGEDVDTAYRHVKGRVVHAHFSFPEDAEGMQAIERQFELLLNDGFDGYFSLEIIRKGDPHPLLANCAENWKKLKAKFGV